MVFLVDERATAPGVSLAVFAIGELAAQVGLRVETGRVRCQGRNRVVKAPSTSPPDGNA